MLQHYVTNKFIRRSIPSMLTKVAPQVFLLETILDLHLVFELYVGVVVALVVKDCCCCCCCYQHRFVSSTAAYTELTVYGYQTMALIDDDFH